MSRIYEDRCLEYLRDGTVPKADADISGTGVILAFLLSAYISLVVVLVAYVTGFVEDDLLNDVDRKVFRMRPYRHRHPRAHTTMFKAVLALSDQQIVTGIAIMGAGFQGLRTGKISVYHYQMVLYLAWMSSSVHLSALTYMGAELMRNPGLLSWRLSGMLVLLVLLIVALIPTISNDWGLIWWEGMLPGHSGWGGPARCFWGRLWGDGINSDAILGFIILAVSYLWKVGALFPLAGVWYNRWVRGPLEKLATEGILWPAQRYNKTTSWYWLWLYRLAVAMAVPVFALTGMFASFAASLWLSILGLVFGTMQVVIPRNQNLWYTGAQEEQWSFGQLVPMILLVQPLGAIAEHIWPERATQDSLMGEQIPRKASTAHQVGDDHEEALTEGRSRGVTLLELIALREEINTTALRSELMSLLYESGLFALVIVLVNFSIAAIAIVVFYVDAKSIGDFKTPKWSITGEAVGYCLAGIVVIDFVLTPFSQLGQTKIARDRWSLGRKKTKGSLLGPRQRSFSAVKMAELKP